MRIKIGKNGKPVFPLNLSESDVLVQTLDEFSNFNGSRRVLVLNFINHPLTNKCFIYLAWMYMSSKFKNFTEPDIKEQLR